MSPKAGHGASGWDYHRSTRVPLHPVWPRAASCTLLGTNSYGYLANHGNRLSIQGPLRLQPQFLERGPESFTVRLLYPILSNLIGGRAARADDDAFTAVAAYRGAHLHWEAVGRVRRGRRAGEQGRR